MTDGPRKVKVAVSAPRPRPRLSQYRPPLAYRLETERQLPRRPTSRVRHWTNRRAVTVRLTVRRFPAWSVTVSRTWRGPAEPNRVRTIAPVASTRLPPLPKSHW